MDSAANSPRAIRDGDTTRVLIPASFAHAIDSVVPGFRPFRRRDFTRAVHEFAEADSASGELIPLFAVVADFDGNKQPDVALYGTQAGNTVLLAVLAESAGPRVVVIFSTPTGPPDTAEGSEQFLQIRHAGTADLPDFDAPAKGSDLQHRPLKLANPGFDLTYLGKGGTLYYYDGHRFRSVTSSD